MIMFCYFVSGHTYLTNSQGTDDPFPVQINTVLRLAAPIVSDEDLDAVTETVRAQLDDEAGTLGRRQEGAPTIRQVNFLHRAKVDGEGNLIEVLS